ncbi:insulinase family protein [Paucihalobacter ruber]|uniref:Insulinase family protein n=1 Tax=Paucihalobacter ruber TaxID=2567861 RepID=A0A506PGA0_9FLAO|nr:pitrilysin family protein [Paucihalobacter ruber]TPV32891.1 insulinase family protein [Paucihalobacter ruber]
MTSIFQKIAIILFIGLFFTCKNESVKEETSFKIDFETFELDNGLKVIFHIDKSDPVVAVALTSHVGSAREKEGRTGFAHLFEHLLFLESENLGKGGLDKMSARIGGSGANGSTSRDRTNYFQTVPNDALEKMIWAEADKLGFFINTVTEEVLSKEKQVVKNEKRQGVDNLPYGHNSYVINKNLYPKGHPYSWEVIGSLEDLQNATLQDVKDFYNQWYVPNNVTLTIAGDFDIEQAKIWVKKYFEEIPAGEKIEPQPKQLVTLNETKKLFHEDNFARLPQLTMTWPGVYQYHEDAYALEVLLEYLTNGKTAPLNKILIDEKKLTDRVSAYQYNSELAGQLVLSVSAFNETNLNDVATAINEAFEIFETEGISDTDLQRIKAKQETGFYSGLSSVLGKGFQLAQYNIFAGDPAYVNEDIKKILAVTPQDVTNVYNKYIKDKHYVATSFVPKGQTNLILAGSEKADVVEEPIIDGAEETFNLSEASTYTKTPSSFDRSQEPPYGPEPEVKIPEIWRDEQPSGIKVYGIETSEVPLVQFEVQIKGGMLLDEADKIGTANLLSRLLTKGTANKTPEALENAIEMLGANISSYATDDAIFISGTTLSKYFDDTMNLVTEIILEPRWDEEEFELLKQATLSNLLRRKANPNNIASSLYSKLVYGENHILANDNLGTETSVNGLTLEDLKNYYRNNLSPHLTNLHVVGDISSSEVTNTLSTLNEKWAITEAALPLVETPKLPETSQIYFFDVPNAKQSVLRIGYPSVAATHPDYYKTQLLNYRLGGGGFASKLTQTLREDKGYTYGVRSNFSGNDSNGLFTISTGVRSNVTFESISIIKEILENYKNEFNHEDLEVTKSFMVKSNARAFETLESKLNMIRDISNFNLPESYIKTNEAEAKSITLEEMQTIISKYIIPNNCIYLVVGDAKTQLDKLNSVGLGSPVLLKN